MADVVLELMTAATARGEVGLVERAPTGNASLFAVMDDERPRRAACAQRSQR